MGWDLKRQDVADTWTIPPQRAMTTWILLASLCISLSLNVGGAAFGAEEEGQKRETVALNDSLTGRAGYLAFETFGRNDSITLVEVMPYRQVGEHTLFADTRFFMSNDGYFGGNVGLGYRYLLPGETQFLGASLWYDLDDTTSEIFQQLGVSLEACTTLWDVRTNLYFPVGDCGKDYSIAVRDARFAGNQVTYTSVRHFGRAMKGFDLELSLPWPTEFARAHNFNITPGTYMFFADDAEDIYGYKVRAEGNITSNIAMQVEMTDDDTFGTTVMLGIEFVLPGGSRLKDPADTSSRIRTDQFVHRNYNVIVSRQTDLQPGRTAINPATGQPYTVQHVSSAAGGSNLGTVDDPYHTIAEAQAAGGDIIFVHGDSVLSAPIVMNSGARILGEGVDHTILYGGYGAGLLPTVNSSASRPTLLGVAGTAVTLASNSEFSGFVLDSPTGYGMVGNSVQNVVVRNVDILGAGLDGLLLQEAQGTNTFYDLAINGALGAGLHVDGGNAETALAGTLNNSAGRAVVIANTTGGNVDLTEMVVNDNGGQGVLIENADGDASFGRVDVRNSTTTGVAIDGGSGDFAFADTSVRNAAGAAVDVRNNSGSFAFDELEVSQQTGGPGVNIADSTADGAFGSLDIATNGTTGLLVRNAGDLAIDAGRIAATNGTAVDIEDAAVDANLTSVSSSNAAVGIRIVDHQGRFLVRGNSAYASGGLIQNAATGALLRNAGTVGFQYVDFDGGGIGVDAADTERLALSYARVTDFTGFGLDAVNTEIAEVTNSVFSNNGAATDNSIRFRADTVGDYALFAVKNTITDSTAGAIALSTIGSGADSSLTFQARENVISTSQVGAAALRVAWNGAIVGSVVSNTFTGTGASSTGVDITTTSTSKLVEFALAQNTFAFAGGNSVGIRAATSGPATITAGQNTMAFDGTGGTGVDFLLAGSANVHVYDNTVTDNAGGGTGILFTSIAGPSTVTLQSNTIKLLSTSAMIDRGIIFTSVTGTVTLLDPRNNTVTGATTSFYAPIGSLTGHTYVNNQTVP